MAKSENISIKALIQRKQLDDLNKTAAEQTVLLKSIETRMMGMESVTGNIETIEEKSLRVSTEAKKEAQDASKKAASDRDREFKLRSSEIKAITEMGLNQKIYKGIFSKIGASIVDKVTPKWVKAIPETLTKISNFTGGEKRRDVKDFVQVQQNFDPSKTRKSIIKDWEELQKTYKEIAKNEKKLKEKRGSQSEGTFLQLAPGRVFSEKREMLANKVKSLDKSSGFDESEMEDRSPTGRPSVIRAVDYSPTKTPSIIGTTASPAVSHEVEAERLRAEENTRDILEKIEINTRPGIVGKVKPENKYPGIGGLLGALGLINLGSNLKSVITGIFSSIGTALTGAFKLLLNPSAILKGILKGFAIAAIIVSIGKGIYDGFQEYMKTGDIGKAIIEGLGSMIEFLTFGLISKDKFKEYAEWFKGKVDEYVINPIINFIPTFMKGFKSVIETILTPGRLIDLLKDGLSWVANKLGFKNISKALDSFSFKDIFAGMINSIKGAVTAVGDWFTSVANSFMAALSKIGIPEFEVLGIKMGPWYPFAKSQPTDTIKSGTTDTIKSGTNEPIKVQAQPQPDIQHHADSTNIPLIQPTKEPIKVQAQPQPDIQHHADSTNIPLIQPVTASNNANIVHQKSEENVGKKEDITTKGAGSTIVSAPTVNTSNKTVNQQSIKLPPRNPDSTSSRYISSRNVI